MSTDLDHRLQSLRLLDANTLERLVAEKLRPHFDLQGLLLLRERAVNERNLRELYRGRAPYELLQNADDVGATRATFVLTSGGLGFLHNGEWFTAGNFESLAFGWSDKDPNVCIGNKGLGFRSVLDVTPSPHLFRVGSSFFGAKFSYALNNGHIQETLVRDPKLRLEIQKWGAHKSICPVMSIPGLVRKQTLSGDASAILDYAARDGYGESNSTAFWLPATDTELPADVLRELAPKPMTTATSSDELIEFLTGEVSVLIPFLRHILDVRLYVDRNLAASVSIPVKARAETGEFSVLTQAHEQANGRTFFQVGTTVSIPPTVKNLPDTSQTLRALDKARVTVSAEIVNGRPVGDPQAPFHVYFPTEERTGVGFVVHGDFYVKPDRTRLMPGGYNEWLFGVAATLAAGPFLSGLLETKRARDVFETLRPMTPAPAGSVSAKFLEKFRSAIRQRVEPFVPTVDGSRRPPDVVVPPTVDAVGGWHRFVGEEFAQATEGRRFLLSSEDSHEARVFLDLAGVEHLKAASFIDLAEAAGQKDQVPEWWNGCYKLMALDQDLSGWPHREFAGRRLVPTTTGSVAAVPDDNSSTILVLPPAGLTDVPETPPSVAKLLEFVDSSVAELLWDGTVETRSWVTSHLGLSTFEVTDFLPRVLQAVAPQLYVDGTTPSLDELASIWRFVHGSIDAAARPIHDEDVWQAVGRLPLPVEVAGDPTTPLPARCLVPAFLAHFPDDPLEPWRALAGVSGLRRVASQFISHLGAAGTQERTPWPMFFETAGVSSGPKLLRYRRIVPGPQVALTKQEPIPQRTSFTGRRQLDENDAVLRVIHAEGLWGPLVTDAARCSRHPTQVVLSEVAFVEGLASCVAAALAEHERGDGNSVRRLRQLTRELPPAYLAGTEVVTFCQSCSTEGRAIGGAATQLERHRWVPTTFGPWTRDESFLRLAGHRFVGVTPSGEELGDVLLPYAIAETVDHYKALLALGLAPLDDSGGASPETLLRFLSAIGVVLSNDADSEELVGARSRWRLVRGAIQESYVALNRVDIAAAPADLRLAAQTFDGLRFRLRPWYFADPGSAVESAFIGRLNLIDTDRAYAKFFSQLGVTMLVPGKTIDEELLGADQSYPHERLRDEICQSLAPSLLALVVSRSENPRHATLVARRLRERFSVRVGPEFRLALRLTDGSARAEVPVTHFYLQRTVVEGDGSGREATYTLHVVGTPAVDLFKLDGDALGVALAPIFLEGSLSEDLAGLFPRVVARYHYVNADRNEMETFLLQQLGITRDAQARAVELMGGERLTQSAEDTAPAPRIISAEPPAAGTLEAARARAMSKLRESYEAAQNRITGGLNDEEDDGADDVPTSTREPGRQTERTYPPTPQQQARGLRGEEELKRRLQMENGWAGFQLARDRRADGCGYDFLCLDTSGRETKLEVKTFVPDGRVVVSLREVREALQSRENYYLVGLSDDGGPATTWQTMILRDPAERLVSIGTFALETVLEAPAREVFASRD
jgi:hypothetical protein